MKRILAGVLAATVFLTSFDVSGISVRAQENEIVSEASSEASSKDFTEEASNEISDEASVTDNASEESFEKEASEEASEEEASTEYENASEEFSSKEEISEEDQSIVDSSSEASSQEFPKEEEQTSELLGDSELFRGSGTESDPYLIETFQDLKDMSEFFSDYTRSSWFKLVNNITVNSDLSNPRNKLNPIPTNNGFTLDGNGRTIKGLYIEGDDSAALFDAAKEIDNLKIEDAVIKVNEATASSGLSTPASAVLCKTLTQVSSCTLKGDISVNYVGTNSFRFGGIVGSSTKVSDCKMLGNIVVDSNGSWVQVAGIAFSASNWNDYSVTDCEMTGNITLNNSNGSIAGIVYNTQDIKNCITGDPEQEKECVLSVVSPSEHPEGNVYGIADSARNCSYCKNYATLSAPSYVIGITHSATTVKKCSNYGQLDSASTRIGITVTADVSGCANYADITDEELSCSIYGIMSYINNDKNCIDCANYGNLTGNRVYGIMEKAYTPSDETVHIKVSDCTNYGALSGSAVFGIINEIHGNSDTEVIESTITVSNCANEGTIYGKAYAAGIVREVYYGGIISGCCNLAEISGNTVAGIAIKVLSGGIITDCVNSGKLQVSANGGTIGGIVGNTDTHVYHPSRLPVIRHCSNAGTLIGNGDMAGIVRSFNCGEISECSNTGDIDAGVYDAAGIVNHIYLNEDNYTNTISNCYNSGSLSGDDIGGIIDTYSCYECNSTLSVTNCYNIGTLSKYDHRAYHIIAHQIDYTGITFSGCYYPATGHGGMYLDNGETDSGMTQCTDSQMKTKSTYVGWDFDSIWSMGSGSYLYPVLNNSGEKKFTITLDPQNGEATTTQVTNGRGRLSSLPRPRREGMQFAGWYTLPEDGDRITTSTVFSENTIIYGHWKNYDPADRAAIKPLSPAKDSRTVSFVDDGGWVNLEISFTTDIPVSGVNTDFGTLRLVEYDTDTVIYETTEDKLVKITSQGDGSKVYFKFMYDGLKDGTRYYIEIDDGFLVFEDDTKYAYTEKGDWVFKTGSRVYYLEESGAGKDKLLPYVFDVDDSYFLRPSTEFNWDLALVAYGLTLSAFEAHNNRQYQHGYNNVQRTFENFGFENFDYNDWYTKQPTTDSIGVSAATKVVKDSQGDITVIALPIRGAGYEAEWSSNVLVSKDSYHQGFKSAADQAVSFLRSYIVNKNITGRIKVMVMGYSRAGGTANVVASLLDDGGLDDLTQITLSHENIYGFCFEPPAVTTKSTANSADYNNIFCFINRKDPVPKVPSPVWKYRHFGKTYYFNDESSSSYSALFGRFLSVYDTIAEEKYDQSAFMAIGNNVPKTQEKWLDYLIKSLSGALSRDKYVDAVQGEVWDILKNGLSNIPYEAKTKYGLDYYDPEYFTLAKLVLQLGTPSASFLGSFSDGNRSLNLGGFGALISYYKNGLDNLIATFSGDSHNGTLLIQEHYPLVNLAWLMVCREEEYTNGKAKSLIINCPVDVELYDSETGALAGKIIDDEAVYVEGSPVVPYVDYNGQKIFSLPVDRSYTVKITATDSGDVNYCLLESDEEEGYTSRVDYLDISISKDDEISGTVNENGTYSLKKDGAECASVVQTDIAWNDVDLISGEYGSVVGSGTYMKNSFVIATAIPNFGAEFDGWYDTTGTRVYDEQEYRFRVDADIQLTARFKERDGLTPVIEEDPTYTGSALKPAVTVYDGITKLTAGKDYTISYKNNTNAYTYTESDAEFNASKAPSVIVTGKGNYKGKETAYFRIYPKNIEGTDVTVVIADQKEDGKAKKPVPVITRGKKKLKAGKDFEAAYLDKDEKETECKAVGEYRVHITGKGNYCGSVDSSFAIYAKERIQISKAKLGKIENSEYTGSARDLSDEVELTYNKTPLVEGTDYEIIYNDDRCSVGKKSITIRGLGAYVGSRTATYNITGWNLKKAVVTNFKTAIEYTGTEIVQDAVLTLNGQTLAKGTDKNDENGAYVAVYSGNLNTGTVTVTYKGINGYTGSIKKTFKITKKALNNTDFELVAAPTAPFVKGGSTPEVTLKFKGTDLALGKDFTACYKNNKALTTAATKAKPQVIVTGKGNFSGKLTADFEITARELTSGGITMTAKDVVATDKPGKWKSAPVLADSDGKVLKAGTDYDKQIIYYASGSSEPLKDTDVVNAGTVIKAVATGMGSYTGEIDTEYRVVKKNIAKASVKVAAKTYTGKPVTLSDADLTVTFKNEPLTSADYEIDTATYKNNLKKGKATVVIRGKGDFGGTKTVSFTIGAKGIIWWFRNLFQ